MYQHFIFKGINSLDMGVVVLKAPPVCSPAKKINEIEIAGRNGILREDMDIYENYTKDAECHVMDRGWIDEVCGWLKGYGEVIFSSEPDKVYRGFIKNQIPINNVLKNINDFLVQFDVFPFKYSVNAFGEGMTLTQGGKVYNQGTVYSEPTITVHGTGNITLTINGEAFPLTGVIGSVTIDSEMMEVYKGQENCNHKYGGMTFPRFRVGENRIDWTGNVARVEVEPKWRWL